ncbi:MAG: hypothetical protein QNJ91_10880 [Gammaproteobacteria bacterium]|nr:hypothetical protein [Gammaproteobacteria bacterium]
MMATDELHGPADRRVICHCHQQKDAIGHQHVGMQSAAFSSAAFSRPVEIRSAVVFGNAA